MAKVVGVYNEEKVDRLIGQDLLDRNARRKLAGFLEQIEVAIFTANREVIHRAVPELDREAFVRLAVVVAEARASYIKLALELCKQGHVPPAARLGDLKAARETYDELSHAFEAMQRVVKRGYSSIG